MTTAPPAPSAHRSPTSRLQLVGGRPPGTPVDGTVDGRVGYLVFLPADVDPAALMRSHGIRPEGRPVEPASPPAPESAPVPRHERVHTDGAIRIDPARRLVEVDGRELEPPYMGFALLAPLGTHPNTVHTRDALISGIWGYGRIGDGRTVDVHIARLRGKLGPAHRGRISTVRRVGYRYVPAHR
ncbi:winged helix-turn-helix domain-containing protein [Streptomyces sp. WM4235]|uniref:winged helix-turn-helix domain-containing protein n=1 Tax=Streptomyces sp. WM4235 TaxID=1415551 RepID=UPI0006AFD1AE|nr:response regulator transcription factor [Streptomyces sp. WM4235]